MLQRGLTDADIQRVAESMKPETLDAGVTPGLQRGLEEWGSKALADLGSEARFDMKNPLVTDFIDAWREQQLVGVTRTTRDQVTALLQDMRDAGAGIDDMKRSLRETFEGWTSTKAETVARTEVVGASNAANLAAYQISGLVDAKEWLAVQDGQTRETHAELDGTQVGIDEDFTSSSGATASGPGLFGDPGEDINCRCTLRPVIDTKAAPTAEERAALWRAFDQSLIPWERQTTADVAKVLGKWLGDCVAAL